MSQILLLVSRLDPEHEQDAQGNRSHTNGSLMNNVFVFIVHSFNEFAWIITNLGLLVCSNVAESLKDLPNRVRSCSSAISAQLTCWFNARAKQMFGFMVGVRRLSNRRVLLQTADEAHSAVRFEFRHDYPQSCMTQEAAPVLCRYLGIVWSRSWWEIMSPECCEHNFSAENMPNTVVSENLFGCLSVMCVVLLCNTFRGVLKRHTFFWTMVDLFVQNRQKSIFLENKNKTWKKIVT